MKIARLALPLTLALVACVKPAEPPDPAPEVAARPAASVIAASRAQLTEGAKGEEETLRAAATRLMRAGVGLSASDAERCRAENKERPSVRELCLALWAYGPEENAELAKELVAQAPRSLLAATGLGWRSPLLRGLAPNALEEAMRQLAGQPLWFRAELLRGWIEQNGTNAGISGVFEQITLREPLTSADLNAYFRLAHQHFPLAYTRALAGYCRPEVQGEARLRCWRLIGTLLTGPLEEAWRDELRMYAPAPREEAWERFRHHFPLLAYSIENTYQERKKQ